MSSNKKKRLSHSKVSFFKNEDKNKKLFSDDLSNDEEEDSKSSDQESEDKNTVYNLLAMSRPFRNPAYKNNKRVKPIKQIISAEKALDWPIEFPTYWSISAPPSFKPNKKYCDITGLQAKYKDPKTNLRYNSSEIYQAIRVMPPGAEQTYLGLRNANVILK
ncbi:hypothetical protein BB559_000724 [Furculomyces boomerangus]|uniref:Vps72/YL1 C-terminal domain-containing protein n=2 Tax=Harpellales TaxID=61421 RepID=A0A2T9Z4A5_9FUNG|nr:hypothetical protein BB559_001282 [Furculomyces boomerangus]PVU99412.1 hypothetical protein BB559_000724 [Furculomyces boomerangus]PWA01179.1 hypothetical protein BB558_002765 [Smittium angustum]